MTTRNRKFKKDSYVGRLSRFAVEHTVVGLNPFVQLPKSQRCVPRSYDQAGKYCRIAPVSHSQFGNNDAASLEDSFVCAVKGQTGCPYGCWL